MILDGLKAMVLGMGMVYIFLVIMILLMKLMSKVLEPYKNALMKAQPAKKKAAAPAKKDGGLSAQDNIFSLLNGKIHTVQRLFTLGGGIGKT